MKLTVAGISSWESNSLIEWWIDSYEELMALVKTLEIVNFKSVRHLRLSCRRVNVFIGKPNTGKSNILESIGLLSHICYGNLGSFIGMEDVLDLFYDRDLSGDVVVKVEMEDYTGTLRVRHSDGWIQGLYTVEAPSEKRVINVFDYDYSGRGILSLLGDLGIFEFYRFRVRSSFPSTEPRFLLPPFGENLLAVLMSNKRLRRMVRDILEE